MIKWHHDEYNKNIIGNYFFRIISMVLGVVAVRVYLGYLGSTLYGLWVTISSIISWMQSGDFGIANGLRNELAKAYAENDQSKQQMLIATAVDAISKVAILLFFLFTALCEVFFYTGIMESVLRVPMYITALFFCINLRLGIVGTVALSYQKSWLTSLQNCTASVLTIISVLTLAYVAVQPNLVVFAVIHGLCTTIPNVILSAYFEGKGTRLFRIRQYRNPKARSSILNTGFLFFGIQICSVVLYSTDNLIINYLFNAELVTKYSIITKVYDTGQSLYSILLVALWSAVTVHIAQQDYKWVRNKIKELLKWWVFYSTGVILVSLLFNQIVKIWLGPEAVYYEPSLIMLFAAYGIITAFSAIFVNIVNGIGIVKLQLCLAIVGAIINIPLSVFFAANLGMGIFGVKFATCISAVIVAIAIPIQAIRFIIKGSVDENSSSC